MCSSTLPSRPAMGHGEINIKLSVRGRNIKLSITKGKFILEKHIDIFQGELTQRKYVPHSAL